MSLYFTTRLFAGKKKGKLARLKETAKVKYAKANAAIDTRGRALYGNLEDKQKHAGLVGLTGLGALGGGALGAGAAGLTLRGLKGRLREAHPDWSDEKVQREYDKVKKKRLAIGASLGAVAGGGLGFYKGSQYKKTYSPKGITFYQQ